MLESSFYLLQILKCCSSAFRDPVSIDGGEKVRQIEEGLDEAEVESSRSGGSGEGSEGVEVSSNILEVDDNSLKCYDKGEEIMSEVTRYEAFWKSRKDLSHLVDNYGISSHILLRLAGVEERACSVLCDHWMPMYGDYLGARLRFPILELLGRMNAEVEALFKWGLKKANLNKYKLGEGEQEEVKRLVRVGGEVLDVMHLTSSKMIEAVELYGRSSLSEGDKSYACWCWGNSSLEEVIDPRGQLLNLQGNKRERLDRKGSGWSSNNSKSKARMAAKHFINSTFLEVDLHGGVEVMRHTLELREELASMKKAVKLAKKKKKICKDELYKRDKVLEEIVDLYRLATMVLAFIDCKKKVKAQYLEVDVTSITFEPQEGGVEEDGESKTANFRLKVKLKWNRDESGRIVSPLELEYEFIAKDDEAKVVGDLEVVDNVQNQEVDQEHQIID
ncbi:hypothetical protein SLEP1_g36858 [Rubroshorea leprosula]|uniref:Uncharacterized protein n=1 Tax=Rubroshorea leprosula TaxID=152421 RepID=A0AAV5KT08_9ROSI|nr:hypothetical protein SLEP1_g36858 [Rubroshorea leprosula]